MVYNKQRAEGDVGRSKCSSTLDTSCRHQLIHLKDVLARVSRNAKLDDHYCPLLDDSVTRKLYCPSIRPNSIVKTKEHHTGRPPTFWPAGATARALCRRHRIRPSIPDHHAGQSRHRKGPSANSAAGTRQQRRAESLAALAVQFYRCRMVWSNNHRMGADDPEDQSCLAENIFIEARIL